LLPTLIRLGLLAAFTVALNDRCNVLGGEPGGELAIAGRLREFRTKRNAEGYVGSAVRFGLLGAGHVAAAAPRRLTVWMVNGCWLWRRGDDVNASRPSLGSVTCTTVSAEFPTVPVSLLILREGGGRGLRLLQVDMNDDEAQWVTLGGV
jgi:hypothetical protein